MIDNKCISRRRFIYQLTVIGATVLALPLAGCSQQATAASTMSPVGKVTDFTSGDYKKVALPNGSTVYVARSGTGFKALSSKCTHRGCDVLWILAHKQFQCPCHGGLYNASGINIAGPPPSPLPSLTTSVKDGIVYVQSA